MSGDPRYMDLCALGQALEMSESGRRTLDGLLALCAPADKRRGRWVTEATRDEIAEAGQISERQARRGIAEACIQGVIWRERWGARTWATFTSSAVRMFLSGWQRCRCDVATIGRVYLGESHGPLHGPVTAHPMAHPMDRPMAHPTDRPRPTPRTSDGPSHGPAMDHPADRPETTSHAALAHAGSDPSGGSSDPSTPPLMTSHTDHEIEGGSNTNPPNPPSGLAPDADPCQERSSDLSRTPTGCLSGADASEGDLDDEEDRGQATRPDLSAQTTTVLERWREVMSKPERSIKTTTAAGRKRRALVKTRLAEGYTVDDLLTAIQGCAGSDFHMGENDRGTRYNDLTLILRADKLDGFIERGKAPPPRKPRAGGAGAPAPRPSRGPTPVSSAFINEGVPGQFADATQRIAEASRRKAAEARAAGLLDDWNEEELL